MTNTRLKWIAIMTMLIDHMGVNFFQDMMIFRYIGRLSFPIFAFLVTEGVLHTRNVKKYILRLIVFGIVSEIPYDLMRSGKLIDFSHQNIFFTLALGVIAIEGYKYIDKIKPHFTFVFVYALAFLAEFLRLDYGMFGILIIFFISYGKTLNARALYLVFINFLYALALFMVSPAAFYQIIGCLSAILIVMYNGEKGKGVKYLFYGIYPVHLLIFYVIEKFLN